MSRSWMTVVAVSAFTCACAGRAPLPTASPPPAPPTAKPSLEEPARTDLLNAQPHRLDVPGVDDGGESGLAPNQGPRPEPQQTTFMDCPGDGDGGDPALNLLKNRIDMPPSVHAVSVDEVLAIAATASKKHRADWSDAQKTAIEAYEGTPVRLEGVLVDAKKEGVESPNCHDEHDAQRDFHLYLVSDERGGKANSVIVEMTPRLRKDHPGWTIPALRTIARDKEEVRITGWLLYDQEHAAEVGKSRGTLWEVHPVTTFEVRHGDAWHNL